ncbi:MAG: beta-galactosidase trimerization domain-containing protein, partial [Phycisphaerae bacterium]|nr:beta-galactosidase trimerization domain-containing protein [Phycisphaerae bacterium]
MSDWWYNMPWRMIQTNLREIDTLNINAERFVADLEEFKANVVMINAAGIIASYPTRLPFHFQSPYLEGDSLKKILAACHAAGIRVIARTDFSKIRRPIYQMHPEWAYVSPRGNIVDYNGDIHVCICGDYQQKYMLKTVEELLSTHEFDGIFFNLAGFQTNDYSSVYHGICHCDSCKERFRATSGLDLPPAEDWDDPVFRKYSAFKKSVMRAHHEMTYNFIRGGWPNVVVVDHLEFRRGFMRLESGSAVDGPLPHWQYNASHNTNWVVSSYPTMVSSNTTVDFISLFFRHVAVSPHEQRLRLAQNLAYGGDIDYYVIGRLDNHADRSGFAPVKEMFHHHTANEDVYNTRTSKAKIALFWGPATGGGEYRGWFRFLVENHHLFDVLLDDTACEITWEKYDVLILPDIKYMSDELAERIDEFVSAGGTLIAVSESSFAAEHHEPRDGPALKCLGIEKVQRIRKDMRSSYFQVDDKRRFPRFADMDLVYIDGSYVYADYAAGAEMHLKLIPPAPWGPPERCYYSQVTDHPGFVTRPFGKGRVIYIPWLPGAL